MKTTLKDLRPVIMLSDLPIRFSKYAINLDILKAVFLITTP